MGNKWRTSERFPSLPCEPVGASASQILAHTVSQAHSLSVACLRSSAMAPRVTPLLAFSLLVLWTFPAPTLGGANDAEDCCLSVTQRPIPGNIVKAFRYLLNEDGCRVPAVVFTTLRGYQLCAPPDQPWVDRIIRRLKKSSAKNKGNSTRRSPVS